MAHSLISKFVQSTNSRQWHHQKQFSSSSKVPGMTKSLKKLPNSSSMSILKDCSFASRIITRRGHVGICCHFVGMKKFDALVCKPPSKEVQYDECSEASFQQPEESSSIYTATTVMDNTCYALMSHDRCAVSHGLKMSAKSFF